MAQELANLSADQELEKNRRAIRRARIEEVACLIATYDLTLDEIEDYFDEPSNSDKLSYYNKEFNRSETYRAMAFKGQQARKDQAELKRNEEEVKRLERELKAAQAKVEVKKGGRKQEEQE